MNQFLIACAVLLLVGIYQGEFVYKWKSCVHAIKGLLTIVNIMSSLKNCKHRTRTQGIL